MIPHDHIWQAKLLSVFQDFNQVFFGMKDNTVIITNRAGIVLLRKIDDLTIYSIFTAKIFIQHHHQSLL